MSEGIWDPGSDTEDDGVLGPSDGLDGDDLSADVLDTGIDAGEHYRGADHWGTTLAEERQGESLDQLLAEEEPDTPSGPAAADWDDEDRTEDDVEGDGDEGYRSGRLVSPDEGAHGDEVPEAVASDVGIDGAGASAEEAAMHTWRR